MLSARSARIVAALAALVAVALLAVWAFAPATSPGPSGSGPDRAHDRPLRVAWINQGAVAWDQWTRSHAAGRQDVRSTFGARVRTTFVEGVTPGNDEARLIDDLVRDGYTLIIATSQPLAPAMEAAARKHPSVHFDQARGLRVLDNLGTFAGADEEPIYLAGMAAGATAGTTRIGYVGTVPEPETLRHVNALAMGARSVDPEATVHVEWIGSWWDPAGEERAAADLLDGGADVIVSGTIGTAAGTLATARGAAFAGHDSDMSKLFPDSWLTAAVPDWGRYYVAEVRAVLAGTWSPRAYFGDMSDGYTDIAPLGSRVRGDVRQQILERRRQLVAGRFDMWHGPLTDADGTLRVPAGETLTDAETARMDWFVDGVVLDERSAPKTGASPTR